MVKRDEGSIRVRERNLSVEELRLFLPALDGTGFAPDTAAAIRLLILCGQRVRETLRIEGSEIDLEGRVWRMPAAKSKIRRPHDVPLPDQAVAVLREPGSCFPRAPAKGITYQTWR